MDNKKELLYLYLVIFYNERYVCISMEKMREENGYSNVKVFVGYATQKELEYQLGKWTRLKNHTYKNKFYEKCNLYKLEYDRIFLLNPLLYFQFTKTPFVIPDFLNSEYVNIMLELANPFVMNWFIDRKIVFKNVYKFQDILKKQSFDYNYYAKYNTTSILHLSVNMFRNNSISANMWLGFKGRMYKYIREDKKAENVFLFISDMHEPNYEIQEGTSRLTKTRVIEEVNKNIIGNISLDGSHTIQDFLNDLHINCNVTGFHMYNQDGEQIDQIKISNVDLLNRLFDTDYIYWLDDKVKKKIEQKAAKFILMGKVLKINRVVVDDRTLELLDIEFE